MNKKPVAPIAKKIEKIERFDSKFVKTIIETFNNVLILVENQEQELKKFIAENDPESSEEEDEEQKLDQEDEINPASKIL